MYVFYMLLNIEQKYNSYEFPGVGKNVSDLLFYKKNFIFLLISLSLQWQENERNLFRLSLFMMMKRKIFKGKTNKTAYDTDTHVIFWYPSAQKYLYFISERFAIIFTVF